MPTYRYSDSDSDLPELDVLINKHVKGLRALDAPKLNASKTTATRSAPRKTPGKAQKNECVKSRTFASEKNASTTKTASRPRVELKTAPSLDEQNAKSKLLSATRTPALKNRLEEQAKVPRTRATPHRGAKVSSRLPQIEDSEFEDSENSEDSEREDKAQNRSEVPQDKPRRRLVRGRRTPDTDSSDSDNDVFHTPPAKQSQRPTKTLEPSNPSDELTQKLLNLGLDESDKENGNPAILRFSPPRARRPIELERPATPPPASPSKSRLVSPSKKKQRIPTPPHAPQFEQFWNVHAVNSWNDEHSPQKPLASPKKDRKTQQEDSDSPSASPKKTQSPSKRSRAEIEAKKDFENRKHQLVEDFFRELDERITDGKISELAASTGGVKLVWSKTLNTTAGRANWKRETQKVRNLDGTTTVIKRQHASIELAEKVIDDEERLLNVVAHEFCHLANFMVSGIKDQPHGHQFKVWGRKCSEVFGHRGVEVTTKHSYTIDYKYIWTCSNELCAHEFKRHSKSIDPARHRCGSCRGQLNQTKPVPRKQTGATGYAAFVKANFASLKQEMAGKSHKEVMSALGQKYREEKAKNEAAGSTAGGIDDMAKALEVVTLDSD